MPIYLDRENWMSHLNPSTRITATRIPASHNSSCYPTPNLFQVKEESWPVSVFQLAGYTAQLNVGIRYFDVKLNRDTDGTLKLRDDETLYFERFEDGIRQIKNFMDIHPGEYIFLDLDFDDPSLSDDVLGELINMFGESTFATAHLNNGYFLSTTTWADLGSARVILTWSQQDTKGKPYLSCSSNLRHYSWQNLQGQTIDAVTQLLTQQMNDWDQNHLMLSLDIDMTNSGAKKAGEADADAWPYLNSWILTALSQPICKLNIVMRDFVTARYNRDVIDQIIQTNSFVDGVPTASTTDVQVTQQDTARFRVEGINKYLSLDPSSNRMRLLDTPDESCSFLLLDRDKTGRATIPYSGNEQADTTDCQGNFRMVVPYKVEPDGDFIVLSTDTQNNNEVYCGVSWASSGDLESFTSFDPDNIQNPGPLYYGARIIIRSMIGAADTLFQKVINDVKDTMIDMIPFVGDNFKTGMKGTSAENIFVLLTYDGQGNPLVFAGSPGSDYATTFIIEKVR